MPPSAGDDGAVEQTETRGSIDGPDPVRDEGRDDVTETGYRFDDPYWDDAFCSWSDPTLRTCVGC